MRYVKTLNIWNSVVLNNILSGAIKLQRGQWLRCGSKGKRCRYVGHSILTIDVVHWQGDGSTTYKKFMKRINCMNLNHTLVPNHENKS